MRRRRPAIFSVRLCLVSHAPSRCTFWLVLHAWQMCVPMSTFFMLLWPTVVVQLWQLCTTLHRAGSKVKFDTEFSWSDHVARLSDRDFKLRYRLTLPAFNELLEMLRSHLKVQDEDKARVAKWGELITEEAKLACALRYLAGGDVKDLQLIYHFSPNHVYKCIWLVVDAVNEVIKIEFPLKDVAKLKVLEAEFRAASRGGIWKGQVGAVNRVHFPMLGPGESDVPETLTQCAITCHAKACMPCCAWPCVTPSGVSLSTRV